MHRILRLSVVCVALGLVGAPRAEGGKIQKARDQVQEKTPTPENHEADHGHDHGHHHYADHEFGEHLFVFMLTAGFMVPHIAVGDDFLIDGYFPSYPYADGRQGYMMIDRDGYRVFVGNEPGPSFDRKWTDSETHYQNFIDCVKSRRQEDLIADIEEGHLSALLCHLGNISYRTGRRLIFDGETETFPGDDEANSYLGREYREGYELPRI